ncbi:hypothetical protein D5F01_LYC00077 [Larimichthys crocea]|uniref:Uncharacterized protein n=1 Tax=Larimichthys crocea TaxID=215358 RepID=A0A6G0J8T8_LARCR|nr:hypothetical protein D5F01_LYC00077 [Larimichthys crocea]
MASVKALPRLHIARFLFGWFQCARTAQSPTNNREGFFHRAQQVTTRQRHKGRAARLFVKTLKDVCSERRGPDRRSSPAVQPGLNRLGEAEAAAGVSQGDATEKLAHQVAAQVAAADRRVEEASGDPHEEEKDEAHKSSKGHVSEPAAECPTSPESLTERICSLDMEDKEKEDPCGGSLPQQRTKIQEPQNRVKPEDEPQRPRPPD